jgi:serine/threonine protein kinase
MYFYGCVSDLDNVYLILELLEGGTLQNHLTASKKMTELETACIIREIGIALKELQDINVIHREIKS